MGLGAFRSKEVSCGPQGVNYSAGRGYPNNDFQIKKSKINMPFITGIIEYLHECNYSKIKIRFTQKVLFYQPL
jgi:hypothetical protein